MGLYLVGNYPMQTTTAPTKVTTGTALKTLMQIKPGSTQFAKIIEWGISFDGSSAATPGIVELVETDVAATSLNAYVANDFTKLDAEAIGAGDPTTAMFSVGTSASGYTAGAEGTVTAIRNLDAPQLIAPTNQFIKQFPLGREPTIQAGKFARIRVTFGAAINALCYMILSV